MEMEMEIVMEKQTIPTLTPHAVELDSVFANFDELLDSYANGCVGLDAREKEATAVSIIHAFSTPEEYAIPYDKYSENPEACARLLYACLMAQGFPQPKFVDDALDVAIEFLEKRIGSETYELFVGMHNNGMNLPHRESIRAHIRMGLLYSDVVKMLPERKS